jgi:hypothetical protein
MVKYLNFHISSFSLRYFLMCMARSQCDTIPCYSRFSEFLSLSLSPTPRPYFLGFPCSCCEAPSLNPVYLEVLLFAQKDNRPLGHPKDFSQVFLDFFEVGSFVVVVVVVIWHADCLVLVLVSSAAAYKVFH